MNTFNTLFIVGLFFCALYAFVVDARARIREANLVGRNKNGTFKAQKKEVKRLLFYSELRKGFV